MSTFGKIKSVANLGTGGTLNGVQSLAEGDTEGAAKSWGTGGLSGIDTEFNGGSLGAQVGELNPYKDKTVKLPGITAPGQIVAPAAPLTGAPVIANPGTFTGAQIGTVAGPTAAQVQLMGGDQNAFRQAQLAAINNLTGLSNGTVPSLAAQQVQQAQQANIASTYALANSNRGGFNPAMARAAMEQGAQQNADMATQAAQAQLSERLQAAGLIGQIGGTGYGQDLDLAKTQASLEQQATLTGYQGGIQTAIAQGQIDQDTAKTIYTTAAQAGISQGQLDLAWQQLQQKYAEMGMDAAKANQYAALQIQQMIQSSAIGSNAATAQATQGRNGVTGQILGGLGSAISGMPNLSGPAGAAAAPPPVA
jgi:hypothetical protein